MRQTIVIFAVWAVSCSVFAQNTAFQPKIELERVHAKVLATSYRTIRSSTGEQDAYIATLSFPQGPSEVARLVDRFREVELPIAPVVLANRQQLTMVVIRDPTCDQSIEQILASGKAAEVYDEESLRAFQQNPDTKIPYYRTVYRSIRIAK